MSADPTKFKEAEFRSYDSSEILKTTVEKAPVLPLLDKTTQYIFPKSMSRLAPEVKDPNFKPYSLKGRTVFITGASRGIGEAIAARMAMDGANIAVIASTTVNNPSIPGTIYTAAETCEEAGGKAIAIKTDITKESALQHAVDETVKHFGYISILVNNASTHWPYLNIQTDTKRFDIMNNVNVRGMFLTTRACIQHLLKEENPHVLSVAPAPMCDFTWLEPHTCYSCSKMSMGYLTLGLEEEFRRIPGNDHLAFNTIWPRYAVATAAVNFIGGAEALAASRTVSCMADVAYKVVTSSSKNFSGNYVMEDDLLHQLSEVPRDMNIYRARADLTGPLADDFFVLKEAALPEYDPALVLPSATVPLEGKVVVVTGVEKCIAAAVAERLARAGAKLGLLAQRATAEGEAAVEEASLPALEARLKALGAEYELHLIDLASSPALEAAAKSVLDKFGRADALVSGYMPPLEHVKDTPSTNGELWDLLVYRTARAHFILFRELGPSLMQAPNPHVLSLVPAPIADGKWFAPHVAYTMGLFMHGMYTAGEAAEFKNPEDGSTIAGNTLWPRVRVAGANGRPDPSLPEERTMRAEVVADAAFEILQRPSREFTLNYCLDAHVLKAAGVTDLKGYQTDPSTDPSLLQESFFVQRLSDYRQTYNAQEKRVSRDTEDPSVPGFTDRCLVVPDKVEELSLLWEEMNWA